MPRSFSSGAASISSYFFASANPFFARMVVIAAVSVVLPWSTCPIVPTFTCGFLRSNFSLAIWRSLNRAPAVPPYMLRWLDFGFFARMLGHDLFGHVLRDFFVVREQHRVRGAAL